MRCNVQLLGCCFSRLRTMKILNLTDINQRAVQSNHRTIHCLHRALTRTGHRRVPCTQVQQFHELVAQHAHHVLLLDHVVRHDLVHERQADDVAQRVEKVRNVPLPPAAHPLRARARAHQRRTLLVCAVPPCCTCVARCVHTPALIPDPLRRHVNYRSTHARPSLDPRSYRACPVRPTTPVRL